MDTFRDRQHWLFCLVALVSAVTLAWPVFDSFAAGAPMRGELVSPLWIAAFAVFAAAMIAAMTRTFPKAIHLTLMALQVAAVMAMAIIVNWAMMTSFLIIVAWQAGLATTPRNALIWTCGQTLAVIAALAQALNPDLCWVIAKAFALQLLLVFTAQAMRREMETAAALEASNRELQSAQVIIATTARDAERLRISRELHDAWGHELTALGLQLEIASHSSAPDHSREHVLQAKSLARALLRKVRDVVSTLRDAEKSNLEDALQALAQSVPVPNIHVAITPNLDVTPDQAHALIRCAQEAVTNSVRHAHACNLWLQVRQDDGGIRLVAQDDGCAASDHPASGSGLVGMRERIEHLGGQLAAGIGGDGVGFTVEAWLPPGSVQPA